ncbi:uncharacterized protein LOC126890983 [Diabrotica virgifera virgifera]|uniref:Zinc finger PHD-type domain-containing protein n=1 Tax=Diabrotica virgifera virgifera TaxID=50390 RepID=A0ABM5L112_DIAVI|nr:uncharacterized protein LOC126890983 [Diabrotica virgifera virgifera]
MSKNTFKELVLIVGSAIQKHNTNMRECVSSEERLMITLRKRNNKSAHGAINTTPNLKEARKIQREKKEIEQRKAAKRARKDLKLDDALKDIELFLQHDDEDGACIFCNGLYLQSRKSDFWIRCQLCNMWAHTECAGVNRRAKTYICDICKN